MNNRFKRYSQCFCGNTLTYPSLNGSMCTQPCQGNETQFCGNSGLPNWYASVYSLGKIK